MISIHALREEGDRRSACTQRPGCHFYPRPPRGGRRAAYSMALSIDKFLSTPSARRATTGAEHGAPPANISIHALREEGD